ncbi:MAG: SusC/RagA family TonB-linked outer membrane protein [Filimonas sp.]|nr:SusC/RagA family TonB-linked outer membrane protein [Filimonas sp.]
MKQLTAYCLVALLCLVAPIVSGQNGHQVTGVVTSGNAVDILQGVTVNIKGSAVNTITDSLGRYSISVKGKEDILVFSFVGYQTKEVLASGHKVINLSLDAENNALNQVVVIGYGQQSRSSVTTSVSKVSEKEFSHAPGANPLLQLQGKVPGLTLQISDGQPGSNPQIFIRGGTSTSPEGDAPLFIVDGFVGAVRNISDLNPDDIESVQVLKDAASTAIYGARAANGIIIVKTKTGKTGRAVTNFKVTSGIEKQAKRYNFTSARDYIAVSRTAINNYSTAANKAKYLEGGTYGMSTGNPRNSRNTLEYLDVYRINYGQDYVDYLLNKAGWETMVDPVTGRDLIFKSTDYQDITFQTGYKQEYDFNISGGTDKLNYYVGLGYLNQDGIVYGTWYKNYTANFKGNYKVSDRISINTSLNYAWRNGDVPNNYTNVLSRSVTMPFTERLYYEDGTPAPGEVSASFRNRLHEVYYKEKYSDNNVYRTNIKVGSDIGIIPGLTFSPAIYWYAGTGLQNRFEAYNEINKNRDASATQTLDKNLQTDAIFNYVKSIKGKHNINAVAGASYLYNYNYTFTGSGYGAPTDNIPTLNATSAATQKTSTAITEDNMMSYFGRVNYDYSRKYLFSASLRYDGSSRFASEHKWGMFPGLSAGWNIHKEDFWKASPLISQLKLRASWGETGNNELSIGDSQGAYATGTAYNYMGQVGILNTAVANNNLVWETTTSYDAGVDIGLFKDRITILLDYYNKLTSNRLYSKPLDANTGFTSIKSNFGSIRSSGFEVELNATAIKTRDFTWDISMNFAYNRSTVVSLPANGQAKNRSGGNLVYDPATGKDVMVGGFAEGERYGGRWAYHMIGVYSTDADAASAPYDVYANGRQKKGGDAIWEDRNKDGKIDNKDMVFMGYIRPDKTGGMANTFQYKGFSLRFLVDYAVGHVIDNGFRAKANGSSRNNNMTLTDVLSDQIWKKPGDHATIPRYTVESDFDFGYRNHVRNDNGIGNTIGNSSNNSLYYSKGDFLAFREVSLSYQLRHRLLKKAAIQNMELYAGVYNLGYITAYDGLSPEIYTGADVGQYPRPLEINFGLKLTF